MAHLFKDIQYATRALRRSPGFALTSILTLALGIGAVTSIFSVLHSVLLKPYAFRDPGSLVIWRETIQEMSSQYPLVPDNYLHYLHLKGHSRTISDAAIFRNASFAVTAGDGHPQVVKGLSVSPNFFSVLGATPVRGRSFLEEEDRKGSNGQIIITSALARRFFGADQEILGRPLIVAGSAKTVVGVLPANFSFPIMNEMSRGKIPSEISRYEIFEPFVPQDEELTSDDADFAFLVVARLQPGVAAATARRELDEMQKSYSAAHHLSIHLGAVVDPLSDEVTGSINKPLWLLFAAVVAVLLIGCANLATLQLARNAARTRDNALRAALGAGPRRLFQASLAESLVLSALGGLAGALLANAGTRLFLAIAPADFPRLEEVHVSWQALAFAVSLSVFTALLFGSLPALQSLRADTRSGLQSRSTRTLSSPGANRARGFLISFEVASSLALLILTGLVLHSFSRILNQDRVFDADGVIAIEVDLVGPSYAKPGANSAFIDNALRQLRAAPGVELATVTSAMPLTGESDLHGIYRADHPLPESEVPNANLRRIDAGYFQAMRIPLVSGQKFGEEERYNPRSAIISQKAANAAWPGENPLGRTFRIVGGTYTVAAVAGDARISDLKINTPVVYLPYWHDTPSTVFLLVRSSLPVSALAPVIRRKLWNIDSQVAIPVITPLDDRLNQSLASDRFQAIVLSSFGFAALVLAALGIYSVIAYTVSTRAKEFGVRAALGSSKLALIKVGLASALVPVLLGGVAGTLAAITASQWLRSLLYDTSPADPAVMVSGIGILLLTALVAALIPAYRSSNVDPISALRQD